VKENVAPARDFPSADAALMPANASSSVDINSGILTASDWRLEIGMGDKPTMFACRIAG